ncbi:MAG: hypothetical protein EAY81_08655 [Bacteroidetes bacterium]|nr:MAG: hypothetical protein EAY81_08655 [Bacteroidota bacterium]
MRNYCKIFLLLFGFAWALGSCKDGKENCQDANNPECENYNPCNNYVPTSADFTIQEELVIEYNKATNQNISCDTVIIGSDVFFTAKQDFDAYTWRILGDSEFIKTDKQMKLWFPRPMNLQVQLIGKRSPRPSCNPNDDGIDTFTRRLVVVRDAQSPLVGEFRGADNSLPSVLYNIKLRAIPDPGEPDFFTRTFTNFPNGCASDHFMHSRSILFSYKILYLQYFERRVQDPDPNAYIIVTNCQSPTGWMVAEGNQVTINYQIIEDHNKKPLVFLNRQFKGTRIK